MLEKKIANELRNHEMDPQSPDLFDTIMVNRAKQNSKPMYWVMGSIAVMFACIAVVGGSKYWGKLPEDGKTLEQVIAIKAKEKATYDSIIAAHDAIRVEEAKKAEQAALIANNEIENLASKVNSNNLNTSINSNSNASDRAVVNSISNNTSRNTNTLSKSSEDKKNQSLVINGSNLTQLKREAEQGDKANLVFQKDWISIPARSIKSIDRLTMNEELAQSVDIKEDKEVKESKETNSNNKLPKWLIPRELNFYAAAYAQQRFANNGLPLGQAINDQLVVNRTEQLGILAEYNIKRSIFAQIGVQWLGFDQSVLPFMNEELRQWNETIVDPGGQTRTVQRQELVRTNVAGGNSYHQFIEIPISIGARFNLGKRHLIQPQFGIVNSFYMRSRGLALNAQGNQMENINGKVSRWSPTQTSVITGATYTYLLGEQFGIYVHPNLRYSLNGQSRSSANLNELNYMFGAQFGLKYILK